MKNLNQMMKQAQQMQAKMMEMQNSLNAFEMTGISGGEMVKVTINGKGEMRKIDIDKTLVDPEEIEMLEDLIVAAHNDAKSKMQAHVQSEMSKITGGMGLPSNFELPF